MEWVLRRACDDVRSGTWQRPIRTSFFGPRIARIALSLRGALFATKQSSIRELEIASQKNARNDIRGDSRDSRTKTGETKSTNTLQVRMHFDSMAIAAHCQKLSDFAAMRGEVLTSLVVRVIKETQVEAPRRSLPRPTLASSRELRLFGNQKRGRFLKTRPRFSFVAMLACRFTVQWTGCKSLRR